MNEIFDHLKKYFLIYLEGLLQIFGIIIGLFSSEVLFWIREESWVKLSVFGSFIVFFIVINIYKVIAEKKLVALNDNHRNCFSKMLNGVVNFFESREDHTLIRDITSFFYTILRECIAPILKELNFNCNPSSRFSLWCVDGKNFNCFYQYTDHPDYDGEHTTCSINEGSLAKAYRLNHYYIKNLPHERTEWEKAMLTESKGGFTSKGVVKKLRMQTRSYFTHSIHTGPNNKKKFIVMFESTNPKGINRKLCKMLIKKSMHAYQLKELLCFYENSIQPCPQHAKDLGF